MSDNTLQETSTPTRRERMDRFHRARRLNELDQEITTFRSAHGDIACKLMYGNRSTDIILLEAKISRKYHQVAETEQDAILALAKLIENPDRVDSLELSPKDKSEIKQHLSSFQTLLDDMPIPTAQLARESSTVRI